MPSSDPRARLHVGGTFHRVERTTALPEVGGQRDDETEAESIKEPLLWEGDHG